MLLLVPAVLLLVGLIALYRWRMRSVPWVFLLVATVVIFQGSMIEAFGVQAGAEIGGSSLIVIGVVTIAGFFIIRPVWRLAMAATLCVLGTILALIAYVLAGLYFADLDTRIDENPILLVPLALVLASAAVILARAPSVASSPPVDRGGGRHGFLSAHSDRRADGERRSLPRLSLARVVPLRMGLARLLPAPNWKGNTFA